MPGEPSNTTTPQTGAIFELRLTNAQKQEAVWTIDLKNKGTVYTGPVRASAKAGATLLMSDETFMLLATGKLDGQKAFMTGKLKTKGNLMLATKLDAVLSVSRIGPLPGWCLTHVGHRLPRPRRSSRCYLWRAQVHVYLPAAFTVRPVYLEWRSCIIQSKSCNDKQA
jgi:putative sterol carrier protein